uniref:Uncharacterized protein n=1 Tax=Arundo donax TaxID=35708 RepID=A0A0A8Z4Y7_ARUDO
MAMMAQYKDDQGSSLPSPFKSGEQWMAVSGSSEQPR